LDTWWDPKVVAAPFTDQLWLALLVAIVVNGCALYAIEWDGPDFEDEPTLLGGVAKSIFLTAFLIGGAAAHTPITFTGRFLLIGWSVTMVTLVSWYTADLA
jgi:hypothetical protein